MDRAIDEVLSILGGGQDDNGRMVLSVLTKDGGHAVLPMTEQAVTEILYCAPLAVLGRKIRGTA